MPVTVSVAEDADFPRIFEIASLAFARTEPFWDLLYPDHDTEAGRKIGAERMRLQSHSDPHTVFLKAVDESSTIVGMAKWQFYDGYIPTGSEKVEGADGEYWADTREREYFHALIPHFIAERFAAIQRNGGHTACLDILGVDPAHQRKLVGDVLVKWGTRKADEMGVEATVESSKAGKGLYQKNGFEYLKDVTFFAPGYEDRHRSTFAWLIRPKSN